MSERFRLAPTLSALALTLALAPQAEAAGFQLREQSPAAQGTSFAGVTAGTSDISGMFFNPATLTGFSGTQFSVGASHVAPVAEYGRGTASPFTGSFGAYPASPSAHANAAVSAVLPALNLMYSPGPDLRLGLGVNVPYGLTTDYQASYIGRYHALKSELKTVDLAPTVAYRLSPQFSVGLSLVVRKADAELTNAVDFGTIVLAGAAPATIPTLMGLGVGPGKQDGLAGLKGSGWGYGFRLGATWQPTEQVRLGFAHQSAMSLTLKGDATFRLPTNFNPAIASSTLASLQSKGFKDGRGEAELKLPAMSSLGLHVDLTPTLALQAEVAHTAWSCFEELKVKFVDNAAAGLSLQESITEEKWRDTLFIALGLAWQPAPGWTLRTGVASDKGAVEDAYRTPRIPDGDRTWFSAGAGYAFSKAVSMDVAYTHIAVKDGPVDLKALPAGTTPATSPNTFRGNLGGNFQNRIGILALSARFVF